MHTFTYLRKQIYLRCHVNAFTYRSINTTGVNWGKLKYICTTSGGHAKVYLLISNYTP